MQDSDFSSQETIKEFENATKILPFSKHGLSTSEDFVKEEKRISYLEKLKRAGLSDEEIKLYLEDDLKNRHNIETGALLSKLEDINKRIKNNPEIDYLKSSPSTSNSKFYPVGHPIHKLNELDKILFGGYNVNNLVLKKRLKTLRRLNRQKEKILSESKTPNIKLIQNQNQPKVGSLWDVKQLPPRVPTKKGRLQTLPLIGPKKLTMYTIKDNKIMRLEPVKGNDDSSEDGSDGEYRAVDIVVPVNRAEEQLLEGMKMSVDDIKKIDRFKNYSPGKPTKNLYLKNIAPSVTQERLSVLFNQFVLDNGGPIDVRLMTGRMRGQAFVSFHNDALAIRALEEINGTILCGRPIIAEFSRNNANTG